MNINTNYLVRGFSAVYSQLEVSPKNTLLLLKKLLIAKNTGENKTNNNKNKELKTVNISRKNLPTMLVENHSSRVNAQDRFTHKTLEITRYHPPSLEPHHDLAQLLAQPLREFQLSPTEAYNKWVVTPAIPKSGSKISPPLLRPAPLPPTPAQKRPTTTHKHASVISELNVVLAKRNAVNVEPQIVHAPAPQHKQSHAPFIRAQSLPAKTHQPVSLVNELNAVLAKRNAANNVEPQVTHTPPPQHKQPRAPLTRAQSQPTTTHQPVSLMSELNAVLAKRNAANINGHHSKHPLTFTQQQIKPPLFM